MAARDGAAPAQLIALVMKKMGVRNARQLADALGMDDIDRERRVRRWIKGENAPSFDYTMLMLSRAGLLTAEADRAWRGAASPAEEARDAADAAARQAVEATRRARAGQARRGKRTG